MRASLPLLLGWLLLAEASAQYMLQLQSNGVPAPEALLGAWGSSEQCAAHRTGGNRDPRLFPYLISEGWIQHGLVFCQVEWQPAQGGSSNWSVGAFARCGEDGPREYRILLQLSQGDLRIRWSEDFTTDVLAACP